MKLVMKPLVMAAIFFSAISANADPYCTELSVKDQLPKKYQKRGPFHSDVSTGWIIGQDQLKNNFEVTDETVSLWEGIKGEFDKRGVKLVVMAAPPRPLFAPLSAVGVSKDADLDGLEQGFQSYIAALNGAGIAAPDLSAVASSPVAGDYYFARDTHWTPMGAAISAAHVHAALGGTSVSETMAKVDASGTYSEKGSLAGVVKDVCGFRPEAEVVVAPLFAQLGTAASLLGDGPELDKVALVGTSFSDRYQQDAYQVADALAFSMNANVDNFSVTGGGLVGAMEAFIRSGALANGSYKTVVWEAPYTTPLTKIAGLRQVLGALETANERAQELEIKTNVGGDWTEIDHSFTPTQWHGVEIAVGDLNTGKLVVEMVDGDGQKTRVKLVKSDRVTSKMRAPNWTMSFRAMAEMEIVSFKIKLEKASVSYPAVIRFYRNNKGS